MLQVCRWALLVVTVLRVDVAVGKCSQLWANAPSGAAAGLGIGEVARCPSISQVFFASDVRDVDQGVTAYIMLFIGENLELDTSLAADTVKIKGLKSQLKSEVLFDYSFPDSQAVIVVNVKGNVDLDRILRGGSFKTNPITLPLVGGGIVYYDGSVDEPVGLGFNLKSAITNLSGGDNTEYGGIYLAEELLRIFTDIPLGDVDRELAMLGQLNKELAEWKFVEGGVTYDCDKFDKSNSYGSYYNRCSTSFGVDGRTAMEACVAQCKLKSTPSATPSATPTPAPTATPTAMPTATLTDDYCSDYVCDSGCVLVHRDSHLSSEYGYPDESDSHLSSEYGYYDESSCLPKDDYDSSIHTLVTLCPTTTPTPAPTPVPTTAPPTAAPTVAPSPQSPAEAAAAAAEQQRQEAAAAAAAKATPNTAAIIGGTLGAVVLVLVGALAIVLRKTNDAGNADGAPTVKSSSSTSNFVVNHAAMEAGRTTANPIYTDTRDLVNTTAEEVEYVGDGTVPASDQVPPEGKQFESFAAYTNNSAGNEPQYVTTEEQTRSGSEILYGASDGFGSPEYEQPDVATPPIEEPQYVTTEEQGTAASQDVYAAN